MQVVVGPVVVVVAVMMVVQEVVVVVGIRMANLDPFLWSVEVLVEVVWRSMIVVVVCVVPAHFQSFQRMSQRKTLTRMTVVAQWAVALGRVLRLHVVGVAKDRRASLVLFVFFCSQVPLVVNRQIACGWQYAVQLQ